MTEREAKIRERCEKATQGPWEDIPWLLNPLASARVEGEKLAQLQNDVGRAMGFMNHVDSLAVYRLLQAALDRSKA